MNVQVVVDANLRFRDVTTGTPGRVHDTRVLRQSKLFYDFEDSSKYLKNIITTESGIIRPYLLGDNFSHFSFPFFIGFC